MSEHIRLVGTYRVPKYLSDYNITGNIKQSRLPSGYTELEYLQGDKTSYINIPSITIDTTDEIYAEFDLVDNGNRIFGVSGLTRCYVASSGTGTCSFCGGTYAVPLSSWNIGGTNIVKMNSSGITVNGTTYAWSGTLTSQTISNFNINNVRDGTFGTTTSITRFKRFYIKKANGTYSVNIFMGKNSSNILGMYDLVSNTFFTNAGTGTFTAGDVAPTPNAPIDIQGVGDKTENLFPPSNKKYDGYTIVSSTGQKSVTSNRSIDVLGWLDAGDYIIASTTDTFGSYLHKYSEEGTDDTFSGWQGAISLGSSTQSGSMYCKSFTLTQRCFCRTINMASVTNTGNIVLVKGSTIPTSYIPYGYKVPIVCGSNCGCVDMGTLNWVYSSTSNVFWAEISSKAFDVSNEFIYGLSLGSAYNQLADGQYCGHTSYSRVYIRSDSFSGNATAFKNAMSGKYLYYQRTTDSTWTAPSVVTNYLSASLYKLGTYGDIASHSGQNVSVNCLKVIFDGTENWIDASSGTEHIYYKAISGRASSGDYRYGYCSHFAFSTATSSSVPNLSMFYYGSENTYFRYDEITSLADWKSWLASLYDSGNPMYCIVPLATATTRSETLLLPTSTQTSDVITVATEIQPSATEWIRNGTPILKFSAIATRG